MTCSKDFREKASEIKKQEKLTLKETASLFGTGSASVSRWSKETEAKRKRNKKGGKIREEQLRRDAENYPDGYQHERAERSGACQSAICHALKRLKTSVKKKPAHTPKQTLNSDRISKRG